MKTWVVANQKGGVAKTTTAIALAGLLAEEGKRVLLIDLDPHASVTHYFDYEPDNLEFNLFNCFVSDNLTIELVQQCIATTHASKLDILPASLALATLDKRMGGKQGMGLKLKLIIEKIADQYDYAIIDCTPLLGILMINALAACQYLIIPVQTEFLAIKGLERMLKTVAMVYKNSTGMPPIVVVPTMYDPRTRASIDSLRFLKNNFPAPMWRYRIPIDTHFRDASQAHLVPSEFNHNSRGVMAYRQLLKDIVKGSINRYKAVLEAV